MARREITPEDAEAFGKRIYEEKVRPTLNGGEEPVGYFLSVDLDSEDWELDESHLKAALLLLQRRPDADVFTVRVGHPAAGEWASLPRLGWPVEQFLADPGRPVDCRNREPG